MATKIEAELIPLQNLHEVVEGVEAEDVQNGLEVMPLQNTGYSLSKALKLLQINPKYGERFFWNLHNSTIFFTSFVQKSGVLKFFSPLSFLFQIPHKKLNIVKNYSFAPLLVR